jgi:hypothetical protein
MQLLESNNVNNAMISGINSLLANSIIEESRNGSVIVAPYPVVSILHQPSNRVLFNPTRDANPFFHLFESLWMLAGRNDVGYVAKFVPRMRDFSDDGKTLNGAYGYRWRGAEGGDQIIEVIRQLKDDPKTRRSVISMWFRDDLFSTSLDKPCNTHIYFRIVKDRLDMTVCNRSNDIIWGLYGANAVHLSMLQELIAFGVGIEVGVYRHLSNNFHMYPKNINYRGIVADGVRDLYNPNLDNYVEPTSIGYGLNEGIKSVETFMNDCVLFCDEPSSSLFKSLFILTIAQPMYKAWVTRKPEFIEGNNDWHTAGREWLARRNGGV